MTDNIIDENKINPNDWLEPYKPIPACEIKDCGHWVYVGNNIYGCRIAEDGLVCDDFNNDDECCMYRQLEYYKETLKAKEQECEELDNESQNLFTEKINLEIELGQLKAKNIKISKTLAEIKDIAEVISLPMGTGKSSNRVILAKQILQKISEVENGR